MAVHLLAAALHGCQTVIAQRQVAAKSNEIPAFAPLLDRLDLSGVAVTADAMHTQRTHAEHVITAGGHYLMVVKGNQKKLRKQLRRLPWREIPLRARTTAAGHGRRRLRPCTTSETSPIARTPRECAPAPHPAPWPRCGTWLSDSCAKQAGPTSPPQSITTGQAPSTQPPRSDSQLENASPLGG
ncbi:ISAs1 family transposase [Streptomyces sp. NPDC006332]|uniref:ISAs1 family transposase n=1 Tax=Streptomyces sp. NPDC006332 TaxID=3155456 RepID=UPI0033B5B361